MVRRIISQKMDATRYKAARSEGWIERRCERNRRRLKPREAMMETSIEKMKLRSCSLEEVRSLTRYVRSMIESEIAIAYALYFSNENPERLREHEPL